MHPLLPQIWKSASVRNVGKLLSANVIAQALGILVYPVLTRLYAPEDFALLSLFASIASVAALVATSEYQYAIVLPKEDDKAHSLVQLCLMLLLGLVAVMVLSIPFSGLIADCFKAPELARWWWLMPLCVLAMGLWNILNYWYIRRKAFTRVSGYQITQSVFAVSGKIGFGLLGWLHGGMILAVVFAPLLSVFVSIGLAWKKHLRELLDVQRSRIKEVAGEYANFPKFNLPRSLVNSVAQSLPIWLLTPKFGLEEVGQLSLALMAAFVPLNIIARACYQVLFQRVSELVQQRQSIRPVLRRFMLFTIGMMAVGMTVVYLIVPQLVTVLFGAEWLEAATIIRRLFPYLMLVPICGSLCFLSDVFGKQQMAMWLETGYTVAMGVTLFLGVRYGTFLTTISLYGWLGCAYLFIQWMWFLWLIRRYQQTLEVR